MRKIRVSCSVPATSSDKFASASKPLLSSETASDIASFIDISVFISVSSAVKVLSKHCDKSCAYCSERCSAFSASTPNASRASEKWL